MPKDEVKVCIFSSLRKIYVFMKIFRKGTKSYYFCNFGLALIFEENTGCLKKKNTSEFIGKAIITKKQRVFWDAG